LNPILLEYVIKELNETTDENKRERMQSLIEEYNVKILLESDEASRLANIYVQSGIIPARFATDALHIATATINNIDFIVSLNFQHIVKHKAEAIIAIEVINAREGYKRIFIYTPAEVINGHVGYYRIPIHKPVKVTRL
jgi:hypothetical protein